MAASVATGPRATVNVVAVPGVESVCVMPYTMAGPPQFRLCERGRNLKWPPQAAFRSKFGPIFAVFLPICRY